MSKNLNPKLTSLDDLINQQHGEIGSNKRDEFEEGFEAFKIGVMMHELRKELGMTQEQLAVKCGTTKNYISRIENNASDIRLSTLMRIFREGFGRQLKLSSILMNVDTLFFFNFIYMGSTYSIYFQ
jgi:DNA-binding XRE family transcriptional regulator